MNVFSLFSSLLFSLQIKKKRRVGNFVFHFVFHLYIVDCCHFVWKKKRGEERRVEDFEYFESVHIIEMNGFILYMEFTLFFLSLVNCRRSSSLRQPTTNARLNGNSILFKTFSKKMLFHPSMCLHTMNIISKRESRLSRRFMLMMMMFIEKTKQSVWKLYVCMCLILRFFLSLSLILFY